MNYQDAADFAESLFMAKNSIEKAVASTRLQQRAESLEFDMRTGGDLTARRAVNDMTPIAAVRCIHMGITFMVYQPEKWLDVMARALLLFRQRFGDKAYKLIQHRFLYHWEVRKIAAMDNVSKQHFATRKKEFLAGLLVLAAQEGLIRLDISQANFQKDRKNKAAASTD